MMGCRTRSLTTNALITALFFSSFNFAQDQHAILLEKIMSQENGTPKKKARNRKNAHAKKMNFVFENEGIVDAVNTIAAHKEANILLPVKDADFEKIKVNFDSVTDVTVDQAWNFLQILLDLSGYTMVQENDLWKIIKKDKTMNREPLPIFVGMTPEDLPESEDRIRYVYFFSNLRVGDNANKSDNEITALMNILLADQTKLEASHYLDQTTNSIILAGKSADIKAAMRVIVELDNSDIKEMMEVLPLNYLSADFVTNLLQSLQEPTEAEKKQSPLLPKPASGATYFSRNVKILPFGAKNAIILLGKQTDIGRIKEFTQKYLDVALDSGKSVLHVYKLQYLDATPFAGVLTEIVKRDESRKTTGQSAGKTLSDGTDIETYFEEVIIRSDKPTKDEITKTLAQESKEKLLTNLQPPSYNTKSDETLGSYGGGNKLIIACRDSDWEKIRKLIEDLDTPSPQIVIEVLITEMQASQVKEIASQLRNPGCFPMPNNVNAQTGMFDTSGATTTNSSGVTTSLAQIVPGYTPGNTPVPPTPTTSGNILTTLQADLLANALQNPASTTPNFISLAGAAPIGSTVIQASDSNGKTWGLLQILDTLSATNIISNPHVIATNNTKTVVSTMDQRLLPDTAANTGGQGTTTIINKWANAPVQIVVTPRISGEFVNLDLQIDITRFLTTATSTNATQQSRLKRQIYTQANVPNGAILALGGLTSNEDDAFNARTPILGRIPILGYFFKRRSNTETDSVVVVFICPTIIQPRLRAGVSDYTNEHINLSKKYIRDGMAFSSLRDPITHWFFANEGLDQISEIDDFLLQDDSRAQEFYRSVDEGTANPEVQGRKLAKAEALGQTQDVGTVIGSPKQKITGIREIQEHEANIDTLVDVSAYAQKDELQRDATSLKLRSAGRSVSDSETGPRDGLAIAQAQKKPEAISTAAQKDELRRDRPAASQKTEAEPKKERPLLTLMAEMENPLKRKSRLQ